MVLASTAVGPGVHTGGGDRGLSGADVGDGGRILDAGSGGPSGARGGSAGDDGPVACRRSVVRVGEECTEAGDATAGRA